MIRARPSATKKHFMFFLYSFPGLLLAALVGVGKSAEAMNMCVPGSMPPVEPNAEVAAVRDDRLVDECLTLVRQRFAKLDYSFGQPIFSKGEPWGEIVRIDLSVSGTPINTERYSRIVCFRQDGLPVKMGFFDMPKSACSKDRIGVTAAPSPTK